MPHNAPMPFDLIPGTVAYLVYAVLMWAARLGLILYVLPRHRPSVAISWIAITLIHPVLGIPLYLFFGRPVIRNAGVRAHADAQARINRERPRTTDPNRFGHIAAVHRDLARLAENLGDHHLQSGNEVSIITDSKEFIAALVREIDAAKHSVHMLYYIYLDDEVSRCVTEALERAAKRGVSTRIVVDASGSRGWLRTAGPRLTAAGAEVRAALPVKFLRSKFSRIDVRNHRKLAVFDNHIAITGSHNVCDPRYGQTRIGAWQDLSTRVTGPAVDELQLVFLQDWVAEAGNLPDVSAPAPHSIKDPSAMPILVSPAGPGLGNQSFRDVMVSAINEADKRVVMTTPYFVPDEAALLALRLRALAGLKVQIIVPEFSNSRLVNAASRPALQSLIDAGAEVYLHKEGLLHAKTLTIDDAFSLIGSGNFDRRSFDINYELNMLLFGAEVTRSLCECQRVYIAGSRLAKPDEYTSHHYARRVIDAAANVLAPLL